MLSLGDVDFEDDCLQTNKDRPVLSAVQMFNSQHGL